MKYGEVIKELRKKRGLTQKQLAETLGVEQSTIGMIELNRRKPSMDLAQKMADFFGVLVDEIYGRENKNEELPANVRLLLRNVQDGNLTNDQIKTINLIVNQFKENNKK